MPVSTKRYVGNSVVARVMRGDTLIKTFASEPQSNLTNRLATAADAANFATVSEGDLLIGSPTNSNNIDVDISSFFTNADGGKKIHMMSDGVNAADRVRLYGNDLDFRGNPITIQNLGDVKLDGFFAIYDLQGFRATGEGQQTDDMKLEAKGFLVEQYLTSGPGCSDYELDHLISWESSSSGIKCKNETQARNIVNSSIHHCLIAFCKDEGLYLGSTSGSTLSNIVGLKVHNNIIAFTGLDAVQVSARGQEYEIANNTIIGSAFMAINPTLTGPHTFGMSLGIYEDGGAVDISVHHNIISGMVHAGQLIGTGNGDPGGKVIISDNVWEKGVTSYQWYIGQNLSNSVKYEFVNNRTGNHNYQWDVVNNNSLEANTASITAMFRVASNIDVYATGNTYDSSLSYTDIVRNWSSGVPVVTGDEGVQGTVEAATYENILNSDILGNIAGLWVWTDQVYSDHIGTGGDYNDGDPITYANGDYVVFENEIWQANAATASGESPATTPAKWDKVFTGRPPLEATVTNTTYVNEQIGYGFTTAKPDLIEPSGSGSFSTVTLASMSMKVWTPAGYTPGDDVDVVVDFCGSGQKGHADGSEIDNLDTGGLGKYFVDNSFEPNELVLMCQFPDAPTNFNSVAFLADQALDWLYANHTGANNGTVSLGGYSLGSGILTEIADNDPAIISRIDQYYTIANRTSRSQDNGAGVGNFVGLVGWFIYGDADNSVTTGQTPLWATDINNAGGDVVNTILAGVGHGGTNTMYGELWPFMSGDQTRGQNNTVPSNLALSSNTVAEGVTGTVGTLSADGVPTPTFTVTGGADQADFSISGSDLVLDNAGTGGTTKQVQVTATNSEGTDVATFTITIQTAQAARGTGTEHKFNIAQSNESVTGYVTVFGDPYQVQSGADNGVTLESYPAANWSQWSGNNTGGGTNGSVPGTWTNSHFPAAVAPQYWYQGDGSGDPGGTRYNPANSNTYNADPKKPQIKISGLAPATTYAVHLLCYRDNAQNRKTEFFVEGTGAVRTTIVEGNTTNDTNTASFTGVQSNAAGELLIYFNRDTQSADFNFGYINAVKLIEE